MNVADNLLTIRGEKINQREEKEKDYHLVERSYGSFMRTIELSAGVNLDNIKPVMSKGVLKLTVSKPAPAQAAQPSSMIGQALKGDYSFCEPPYHGSAQFLRVLAHRGGLTRIEPPSPRVATHPTWHATPTYPVDSISE